MPLTDIDGARLDDSALYAGKNLIINGAMQVAQRGTSQTGVSDGSNEGYTTVDRFPFNFSSGTGGAATLSQSTEVPSNQGFSSSYKADVTTTATLSAGNTIIMQYLVEAQDIRNSDWTYTDPNSFITLSFWAKSSKSGTHCVFFDVEDASNNQHRNEEYTLTADTWKKITIPLPGHANLVFNNDNGRGLNIQWILASSASATAGSWVDSGDRGTSNQVNIFDSTDGEFFLTGVQLEVGASGSAFEHRSYGDELRRCQRYYWNVLLEKGQTDLYLGNASQYNSTLAFMVLHPPVTMRTEPSIDVSNATGHFASLGNNTATDFDTFSLDGRSGATAVTLNASVSGTTGHALFMRSQNTAAKLAFSAEL